MPFEYLVGLEVTDSEQYQTYRDHMTPILEAQGGGFRYDFEVARTLKSATPEAINRVFCIYFPSREAAEKFFSDEEYGKIKQQYFTPSVKSTTIMAEYDR